jgi:hypothetical protein
MLFLLIRQGIMVRNCGGHKRRAGEDGATGKIS